MSRVRPDYSPRWEDSMKGIGQTQNSVMLDVNCVELASTMNINIILTFFSDCESSFLLNKTCH